MQRILIIYSNIEILKDFTDLLLRKDFVLQCISLGGASLISALEFHPDVIIIEGNNDIRSKAFLEKLIAKKFLFKASIHIYLTKDIEYNDLPGVKPIRKLKEIEQTLLGN